MRKNHYVTSLKQFFNQKEIKQNDTLILLEKNHDFINQFRKDC